MNMEKAARLKAAIQEGTFDVETRLEYVAWLLAECLVMLTLEHPLTGVPAYFDWEEGCEIVTTGQACLFLLGSHHATN